MYTPEMRGHYSSQNPTPRFDAIMGTIWSRKASLLIDISGGTAAIMADALSTHGVFTFAASAVIIEFARAGVVKGAVNEVAQEPLFEERTVFRSLRDAWKTKKIQYTPRQDLRRGWGK